MTSRTTPVGVLVLALAGIVVMGCNAQTSAVFEALVDPGRALVSPSEADTAAEATAESSVEDGWWSHPDGRYRMTLPSGWSGVDLDGAQADGLIAAVAITNPALAGRIEAVLGDTDSEVSAIAADPLAGENSSILLVLQQPTESRGLHEIKQHVKKQVAQLPGLVATPIVQDAGLPTARAWRFDFSIVDDDLGELRVRAYLSRFGSHAYLVSFVASEADVDDADSMFDAIAESLSFGV